jgi:4-hydroxybenzoyl-CoA thioesterase
MMPGIELRTATNALIGVAPVTIRRQVEFGECDPAGIVYTPRFADYLLGAFHWFMAVLFQDIGRGAMPEATPMRGLELDFRAMLFPGDWFTMSVYVTSIRTRSFDLAIIARREDGTLSFLGRLSPISTDRATNDAVPLPYLLATRLRDYQSRAVAPAEALITR